MTTTITTIVDNIPHMDLGGEWGLSFLVEYGGKKILADVGASDLFSINMEKLGLPIQDVDYATLSHAHYDHANGMHAFFKENKKAKFYVRESTADNCYSRILFFKRYIGIPKHILEDFADRIELVSGDVQLFKGAYLIPHKTQNLEAIGKREKMYQKIGRKYIPDNFSHEQSLVLDTDKGLVIINCCSHGGVVNIIHEVASTFPDKHIHGIIGGFHLFNKSDDEVRQISRAIKATGIEYVCTGHCTKEHAYNIMKEELGDTVELLHAGLKMQF